MPDGEQPTVGVGDENLAGSSKAAREALVRAVGQLGPEADQQGGLPGGVDPTEVNLAERALGDLEGVGPGGGSQREKQGFFRKAAGKVGRTVGNIAGGIGGGIGAAAGGAWHGAGEGLGVTGRAIVTAGGGISETAGKLGHIPEALWDRMGAALENKRAFGKSIADFALRGGATGALRFGTRELAKSVVAWSGLAGAVGGGLTGTIVAGAFVGAVGGAAVEYARQVAKNVKEGETDLALAGRKSAFLRKLKPNDYRRIGKAAIFGAIAGAGAGALVEYVPEISEFARQYFGGVRSVFGGVKQALGNVQVSLPSEVPLVEGAKNLAGGGAKEAISNAGRATGEVFRGVMKEGGDLARANIPGVKGAGDLAGGLGGRLDEVRGISVGGVQQAGEEVAKAAAGETAQGAGQAAEEAAKAAPEGFIPQGDFDVLKDQFTAQTQDLGQAHQTIEDLQRQLTEAKQALAAAKETVPAGAVVGGAAAAATETGAAAAQAAAEQAAAHAQSALESFGGSIPLLPGSNPWEVSTDILKQMGVTNPSPGQIMQLDKVLCQENSISVPSWGIKGVIDDRNLPVGFKLNLTDVVKKAALEVASKK